MVGVGDFHVSEGRRKKFGGEVIVPAGHMWGAYNVYRRRAGAGAGAGAGVGAGRPWLIHSCPRSLVGWAQQCSEDQKL